MIASFTKNFLFIRTRKTASTSTEIVLGTCCGGDDIMTPVGVDDELIRRQYGGLPQNFCTDPELEQRYRQALLEGNKDRITRMYRAIMKSLRFEHHMPARQLKPMLPDGFWQNAFKFAVDRHPYEKVVSLAYWRGRREDLSQRAVLDRWIDQLIEGEEYRNSDLYLVDGHLAVDRVLRYERLAEDLNEVAELLEIQLPDSMPHAKSQYRSDRRRGVDVLNDYQKRRIQEVCRFDFEVLGYEA